MEGRLVWAKGEPVEEGPKRPENRNCCGVTKQPNDLESRDFKLNFFGGFNPILKVQNHTNRLWQQWASASASDSDADFNSDSDCALSVANEAWHWWWLGHAGIGGSFVMCHDYAIFVQQLPWGICIKSGRQPFDSQFSTKKRASLSLSHDSHKPGGQQEAAALAKTSRCQDSFIDSLVSWLLLPVLPLLRMRRAEWQPSLDSRRRTEERRFRDRNGDTANRPAAGGCDSCWLMNPTTCPRGCPLGSDHSRDAAFQASLPHQSSVRRTGDLSN